MPCLLLLTAPFLRIGRVTSVWLLGFLRAELGDLIEFPAITNADNREKKWFFFCCWFLLVLGLLRKIQALWAISFENLLISSHCTHHRSSCFLHVHRILNDLLQFPWFLPSSRPTLTWVTVRKSDNLIKIYKHYFWCPCSWNIRCNKLM